MWLDRLAHAPPSDASVKDRNYSPSPKRPSQFSSTHRAGLGVNAAGSSVSLGLSSNDSNTSLPMGPGGRVPNGSGLRHEQRPYANVPDPLILLRSILGLPTTDHKVEIQHETQDRVKKPRKLETDIDFGSLSLEDYAQQDDPQPDIASQSTQPNEPGERERYTELHADIEACDQFLHTVESDLTKFQHELGAVSTEIENLQARSTVLKAKLENRTRVEKLLGPAVEEISISSDTVRTIADGPIDENWIKALRELESRSASIEKKQGEPIKALEDVKPLLRDIKAKAIERIRDFIVSQIKSLRSPNINAQIIQQNSFIKYKDLYRFLHRHSPVLAEEITQAYVNTMKWYYSSNFSRYMQALDKIHLHTIDAHELLGAEPTPPKRTVLSSTKTPAPPHDPFTLGRRADILSTRHPTAISAYTASEDKSYHYLEVPFYNLNLALTDAICAEYTLISSFFSPLGPRTTSQKTQQIFAPTLSLAQTHTKSLLSSTTDALGTLLCVRIMQHLAFLAQRRTVPVADTYINATLMLLWPRFQLIMDAHVDSLRRVQASSSAAAAAVTDPSLSAGTGLAPHPLTQRFAMFLAGLLTLSSEAGDDEPVGTSLGRLRAGYEAALGRLAGGVGGEGKRERFRYYNYSLVLTIIADVDVEGRLGGEYRGWFEGLVKNGNGGAG